ncbi:MAG TPA: C40 family peptidase [Acidimicrobiales bacterium]|nr:C40 family peptidase [Acidimicrobiales bacterium]
MVKLAVSCLAVLLAFVLGLPLLVVAGARAKPAEPASLTVPAGGTDARAEVVLGAARSALGTPYVWGGASPSAGFDCSGLVQWAYRQAGINLPRTTAEQIRSGVAIDRAELRPGDLVFSRGGRPVHDFGHVGIYVGDNKIIIAPHSGEVVSLRPLRPGTVQAARRVLADQTSPGAR